MRRFLLSATILFLLIPAWALSQGWPSYTMPLVARDGVFLGADHSGGLFVAPSPVTAFMGWPVQVTHVAAATHIVGSVQLVNQAGMVATFTGTSLNVNCTGCAGGSSDAVNVFHQSTVAHVSSVVHMAGVIRGFGPQATDLVDLPNTSLRVSQGPARWPVSHVTSVTHVTLGRSPQFTMMVANCGTGASTVLQANPNRRKLILQNSGQAHIAVGGGHVTVTIANGFLLMSATAFPAPAANVITSWNNSRLELDDYQGPIQCIGQGANQRLDIIQVLQP